MSATTTVLEDAQRQVAEAVQDLGLGHQVDAMLSIQGFGKVRRPAARMLSELGVRIIAVSDADTAVLDPGGLDVGALERHVDRTGSLVGFEGASHVAGNEVLTCEVDLLVPAAIEGVIDADVAEHVRARIVVEGTNGPVTPDASLRHRRC